MARIVIIGGSFGGLTAAFQLKRSLGRKHEIKVIADSDRFVFQPSLPWLAFGWREAEDIALDLNKLLPRRGISFLHDTVLHIEADQQAVVTTKDRVFYDYLVIATGPHLDFEAVPGLGPEKGYAESIFTLEHSQRTYRAWQRFLAGGGGPVIVGSAQGVSCFGPAYEYILEMDHVLRKLGKRSKTHLYFVTSEPYLGHFGIGGVGKSRRLMEDEFAERDIKVICNAVIEEVTPGFIKLKDGPQLPYQLAMIAPPFRGVDAVLNSGLGNPKGWLLVDEYFRLPGKENIYAAGVAVGIAPPEATPVPTGVPKTGSMTVIMAKIAACNIAADIQGKTRVALPVQEIGVSCLADMGDSAALMVARPALPPRQKVILKKKRWLRWLKMAFERYYMIKMGLGATYLP